MKRHLDLLLITVILAGLDTAHALLPAVTDLLSAHTMVWVNLVVGIATAMLKTWQMLARDRAEPAAEQDPPAEPASSEKQP